MQAIKRSVERAVEKGKVQGTVEAILSRIQTTTKLESAKDADVVIEAVLKTSSLKEVSSTAPDMSAHTDGTIHLGYRQQILPATKRPRRWWEPTAILSRYEDRRGGRSSTSET
jgi:3-hydroxybutyryl-CoA dehydrogenase